MSNAFDVRARFTGGSYILPFVITALLAGCDLIQDLGLTGEGNGVPGSSDAAHDGVAPDASSPSRDASSSPVDASVLGAGPSCGDMRGLQEGAPWPMAGRCPTHQGRSPYVSARSNHIAWTVTGSPTMGRVVVAQDGTLYAAGSGLLAGENRVYAVDPDGGLKWSVATGASTPRGLAIGADGTLFVGTSKMNGVGQFIGGTLFAIHPDGSTKWELNGYPFGEIAIGGDRTVYSTAGDGVMRAVTSDGTLAWSFSAQPARKSYAAGPTIAPDGTLYFASGDGNVYALDSGGAKRWTFAPGVAFHATPSVGNGGDIYTGGDGQFFAIHSDGTQAWQFPVGVAESPAIGAEGTIYVGDNVGAALFALKSDGSRKWGRTGITYSTPVVGADETVYFSTGVPGESRGTVEALNPDGTTAWSLATGGFPSTFAIGAKGTLYFGAGNKLFAVGP